MTVTGIKVLIKKRKSNKIRQFSIILVVFLLGILPLVTIGISDPMAATSTRSRENHAPKINITYPSNDMNVSGIILVTGTASDDVAVKWVNVVINSVHYNATDSSGNGTWYTWNYTLNTTNYSNGDLRIAALAHDGSLAEDTAVEVIVNNTLAENERPKIWIETPGNNTEVKGTIKIKGHANDDDKVRLVDFVINEKEYQATDTSGNGTWWSWKLVFDTTKLKNGEYWVTAWAWDKEDKGGHDKILIIINNTENHWPYCNITHPENEATVSGEIIIKGHAFDIDGNVTSVIVIINGTHYNATDTSCNGSWYIWSLKFNTTILKDGEYKIKVLAKDNGGKLGDEAVWILVKNTKENKEPHVTITHPKKDATVRGIIKIKGHAWDDDGSIKLVQIRIAEKYYNATDNSGNGSWYKWSMNFNTTKLKDGEYKIKVLAKDNKGKLTDAHIWILIKNKPTPKENAAPHIKITHPTNEATVKGITTIKGKAWDEDGKVVLVQIKIGDTYHNATDNSGNGSWQNWSFKLNTSKFKDGELKIIAIAKDNLSKLGDAHIWLVIKNKAKEKENLAPYIKITLPIKDTNVSGKITIKGKAWDSDGNITLVKIRIAEVWYNATDKSTNNSWYHWELKFNTTKLKNGEYKITGAVYDGKAWGDHHIWVNVQNKLPFVKILSPTSAQNLSGQVNISGKASAARPIKNVKVRIGDKKFDAIDSSGNNTWYSWYYIWNTSGYENGEYRISAIVDDGLYVEDTHVKVKVNNTQSINESNQDDEKPKRKKRRPIPGFELPLLVIGAIAVVVAFFRSGRLNGRTR